MKQIFGTKVPLISDHYNNTCLIHRKTWWQHTVFGLNCIMMMTWVYNKIPLSSMDCTTATRQRACNDVLYLCILLTFVWSVCYVVMNQSCLTTIGPRGFLVRVCNDHSLNAPFFNCILYHHWILRLFFVQVVHSYSYNQSSPKCQS